MYVLFNSSSYSFIHFTLYIRLSLFFPLFCFISFILCSPPAITSPVSFGYCLCHLFLSFTLIECLSIFSLTLYIICMRDFLSTLFICGNFKQIRSFLIASTASTVEKMFSLNATLGWLFASYTISCAILKAHVNVYKSLMIYSKQRLFICCMANFLIEIFVGFLKVNVFWKK